MSSPITYIHHWKLVFHSEAEETDDALVAFLRNKVDCRLKVGVLCHWNLTSEFGCPFVSIVEVGIVAEESKFGIADVEFAAYACKVAAVAA